MQTINNMNDLQKLLMPTMKEMVGIMADRVYETLNYFLQDYYSGYDPISYQRTKDFLYSAVKIEPKVSGNKVTASVFIDTNAMDNYYNATGYQVATWANQGLHGGIETDHKPHVWDDTMDSTINNGELLRLAKEYLESRGISVSN